MRLLLTLIISVSLMACTTQNQPELKVQIFQTSASGEKLTELKSEEAKDSVNDTIELFPSSQFQTIEGIGGAFTESSAYLLNGLSKAKREEILKAYFSPEGANY